MLIAYEHSGSTVTVGIGEKPRPAVVVSHPAKEPTADDPTGAAAWDEIVTPAETDAAFEARMIAQHVPAGARYLINPTLPDGVPPERWVVNWDTGSITVTGPSVADLKARAADARWRKETGGTTVSGIAIPTDDRAKLMLLGASASMADTDTAPYVVGANAITLTGAQFKGLYAGLVAHVQSCFATQTAVLAQIDAGTITTFEQIDQAFAS